MADQQNSTEEEAVEETPTFQQEENIMTEDNSVQSVSKLDPMESISEIEDQSLPQSQQGNDAAATGDEEQSQGLSHQSLTGAATNEGTSSVEHQRQSQGLSHQSLTGAPTIEGTSSVEHQRQSQVLSHQSLAGAAAAVGTSNVEHQRQSQVLSHQSLAGAATNEGTSSVEHQRQSQVLSHQSLAGAAAAEGTSNVEHQRQSQVLSHQSLAGAATNEGTSSVGHQRQSQVLSHQSLAGAAAAEGTSNVEHQRQSQVQVLSHQSLAGAATNEGTSRVEHQRPQSQVLSHQSLAGAAAAEGTSNVEHQRHSQVLSHQSLAGAATNEGTSRVEHQRLQSQVLSHQSLAGAAAAVGTSNVEHQCHSQVLSHQSLAGAATHESTSSVEHQRRSQVLSHQSLAGAAAAEGTSSVEHQSRPSLEDKGASGGEIVIGQVPYRTTSGSNQVKHLSLHREILSPLGKGVQSVPIFALSPTQAKKFADAGFIKPHTSKAELNISGTNVKASGAAAIKEKLQGLADDIKKASSNKIEPLVDPPAATHDGSSQDGSSCSGSEEEEVVAVHMESLSLSALDQQKNPGNDEGKGDVANTTNVLGTSSTLSDTTLMVIEKKTQYPGKTRSKSLSFLKLSSSSLRVLSLNCIGKGVDINQMSSDEATSYKSSLDETANQRSDKEMVSSKKKKKQKKKRKWIKKSTSDTTKESETAPSKMKPADQTPIGTPFARIRKDQYHGTETPSHFLEWDHFGEDMMKDNASDRSLEDESFVKSAGKVQYHRDMISIFKQVEKEGGPKLAHMVSVDMADEEKLCLAMAILHLHQKKEDILKMMEVTQEHLWASQSDVETLHSQLSDMEACNRVVRMDNMKMEEKLNRSGSLQLQIRTELETKITVLEREIERLEKALQQPGSVHEEPFNQDESQAEIKVLRFQNCQLHEKVCQTNEELNKQRVLSQSFTQFTEYLKFRLLLLEEKLAAEKQNMHSLIGTISSTNTELVTCDVAATCGVSLNDIGVEMATVPEHDNPVAEVKSLVALVQKIVEEVAKERGKLGNAVKITLEESKLQKSNLQAELDSLKSEQDALSQKEVKWLQERCLQLCEDNDRLEDMCIQNAQELKAEKEKYEKMAKDGKSSEMSYGQLIVDHLHLEDDLKQRLLVAETECGQAKKDVTEKIHQVSDLHKKCSALISVESQLRMELERMREDSQHTIHTLEENQTLAISSLHKQRTKQDTDKQEYDTEMAELKKALQQVCESLKKTTQQNLELMRQCQNLEKEKKEREEHVKDLDHAVAESQYHLEDTKRQLHQSHNQLQQLHGQYSAKEMEKQQEQMKMKQEMDGLKGEHQQVQCQLAHHKRLVEELQDMVKKQEIQHDEVLEELLQRNVEHDKAVEQVKDSTKCIQELQEQYTHMHGEKENLRGMLEAHLQRLLKENRAQKGQLCDNQQLMNEQHDKCHKLSQDLKSATEELKKHDCTIESLRQDLAVLVATQKKEFDTKLEENVITRASLEGKLCHSECKEKELRASEHSLQVQLAVQMQTVRLLEEERRKNAGLEQKLQAMENQLQENNKSLELSSSSSVHQANEIKMLSDAVNATRNQLKELIEDKMHTALLSQLKEKQELTDKLTQALSMMDNYEQYLKQDADEKENLAMTNQHLQEECNSLTSLLEEERQKNDNATLQMKELEGQLLRENHEKLMHVREKERMIDWNENMFRRADSLSSSLSSISAGQSSELTNLKENSGKLASDIHLILRLPSSTMSDHDKPSSIIDKWSNPYGFLHSNNGTKNTAPSYQDLK